MNITQDQAICMLFYKECNKENAKKCKEEIDKLGTHGFQVCYKEDPSKPILVSKLRILGDPINFHTYPEVLGNTQTDTGEASSLVDNVVPQRDQEKQVQPDVNVLNDDDSTFEDVQTCAFINKVFLAKDPENDDLYYQLSCTVKNIFHVIKKYTMFEDSSLFAFQNWCLQQDLHFWKAQKSNTSNEEKLLILFKLKMEYFDEALEAATKEAAKICRA